MRFVYVARGPERENKWCADILLKVNNIQYKNKLVLLNNILKNILFSGIITFL